MKQHFTCTGFVVEGDKTLLLWHQRLRAWLPPGGHLEANEDPVSDDVRLLALAALRLARDLGG